MSKTISRVMYQTIIYLVLPLPVKSSDLPESRRAVLCSLFVLASDGVYMCPACYQSGGSLLHCLSTLTINGGLFLLHYPWSHLHRTLSGILPCEARTFLTCNLSVLQPRSSVLLITFQLSLTSYIIIFPLFQEKLIKSYKVQLLQLVSPYFNI